MMMMTIIIHKIIRAIPYMLINVMDCYHFHHLSMISIVCIMITMLILYNTDNNTDIQSLGIRRIQKLDDFWLIAIIIIIDIY